MSLLGIDLDKYENFECALFEKLFIGTCWDHSAGEQSPLVATYSLEIIEGAPDLGVICAISYGAGDRVDRRSP